MKKHTYVLAVVLLLLSSVALAQQPMAEPPVFTYVAEWSVARAQWDEFGKNFEQNNRPILERLVANGTLVGWGSFATYVHKEDATTHGTWWSATSVANIEKARAELIKVPATPAMMQARHHDYLLRSLIHKGRTSKAGPGFLVVSENLTMPGKGQDWRQNWEKNVKPVFDELLAGGAITQYSVDVEQVHTQDPGSRFVWYTGGGADVVDKVGAALQAANEKRSEAERQAIQQANQGVTNGAMHRDYYATITNYAHK